MSKTGQELSSNVEMNEDVAMKIAIRESLGEASPMVQNPGGGRQVNIDQLREPGVRSSNYQVRYYNGRMGSPTKTLDQPMKSFNELNNDPSGHDFMGDDQDDAPPSTPTYAASRHDHSTKTNPVTANAPTTVTTHDVNYLGRLRFEIMNRMKLIAKLKIDVETLNRLKMLYCFLGRSDALTSTDPIVSSFICLANDAARSKWNVGDTIDVMLTMFG